jgi:hypothetical protein
MPGVENEHLREQERRAGRDGWAELALNPALSERAATGRGIRCRSFSDGYAQLVGRELNRSREGRTNRFPHGVLLSQHVGRKMAQQQTLCAAVAGGLANFLRRRVQGVQL